MQKDQEIVELQAQVQQLTENLQKSQQRVRDLEATLTKVYAEMKKPGPAGPVIQNLAEILHNELSEACTNDQKAAWQHSLREVADMTVDMWEASRSALCPTLWGLLEMIFKRQLGNASAAAAQRIKRSLLTAMDSLNKVVEDTDTDTAERRKAAAEPESLQAALQASTQQRDALTSDLSKHGEPICSGGGGGGGRQLGGGTRGGIHSTAAG